MLTLLSLGADLIWWQLFVSDHLIFFTSNTLEAKYTDLSNAYFSIYPQNDKSASNGGVRKNFHQWAGFFLIFLIEFIICGKKIKCGPDIGNNRQKKVKEKRVKKHSGKKPTRCSCLCSVTPYAVPAKKYY